MLGKVLREVLAELLRFSKAVNHHVCNCIDGATSDDLAKDLFKGLIHKRVLPLEAS